GQVKYYDEAIGVQQLDVSLNRGPVIPSLIGGGHVGFAIPAGLVQRYPYCIDVPALHRRYGRLVTRTVEDSLVVHALILGAGTIHAVQYDGSAVRIDQF